MWTFQITPPRGAVPYVGLIQRIKNYWFLRRTLKFSREIAWRFSRYHCSHLRAKPRHRPWFVPGIPPKEVSR
jgi:hypothetical protein